MLSGGGTAGHITPLLAVAKELKVLDPTVQLEFIGQRGDRIADVVHREGRGIRCYFVHAGKYRRFHELGWWDKFTNFKPNLLNVRDFFLVVLGFIESVWMLILHRPDVLFFKGGFVVVPVGYAARLLRIPYITHDSDALPGLANRLIAKGAKFNAVAHSGVTYYPLAKTVVTGVPVSDQYEQRRNANQQDYRERLSLPLDARVLFVFAGTQGSRVIDAALREIVPQLLERDKDLYIVHVFGRLNERTMRHQYEDLRPEYAKRARKLLFIDNAFDYVAAADLIIGRAGATSMAEFAMIGRACVIVPALHLTGGHQLENAKVLVEKKAIASVDEDNTLPKRLLEVVAELLESREQREQLAHSLGAMAQPQASKQLAELILRVGRKKQ